MKTRLLGVLIAALALCLPFDARAAQKIIIDFEGLSEASEFPLDDPLQGVFFENVVVMTPATVHTSTGPGLTAATSGQSAASTFGARMRFSVPVVEITMAVSPSFVSVNLQKERGYHTAHLKAYAQDGNLTASAVASVIAAVAEPEEIGNVTPSIISVSSPVPIAYATIDLDDPWDPVGSRLLFDDVVLTVVEQVALVPPILRIEREHGNRIMLLRWDYPGYLQQSNDLKTWTTVSERRGYWYRLDTKVANGLFFRVIR